MLNFKWDIFDDFSNTVGPAVQSCIVNKSTAHKLSILEQFLKDIRCKFRSQQIMIELQISKSRSIAFIFRRLKVNHSSWIFLFTIVSLWKWLEHGILGTRWGQFAFPSSFEENQWFATTYDSCHICVWRRMVPGTLSSLSCCCQFSISCLAHFHSLLFQ